MQQGKVIERFLADLGERSLLKLKAGNVEKLPPHSGIYAGYDPTADSLHIGNFLALNCLLRATHRFGIPATALVGSGTVTAGGDPSFRTRERNSMSEMQIMHNASRLKEQIERIDSKFGQLCNSTNQLQIVDNSEWLNGIGLLEFLRLVGPSIRIIHMLEKDSMKARLESTEKTATFGEFCYPVLQAFDFYTLSATRNVNIQLGGTDQWGNMSTGIDFLRKTSRQPTMAICTPLLTDSHGIKIGKSGTEQVWLEESKTKHFDFYQHFLRIEDSMSELYLKYFTMYSMQEIEEIMSEQRARPEMRVAQTKVAEFMMKLVHGEKALSNVKLASSFLFQKQLPNGQISDEVLEILGRNGRIIYATEPSTIGRIIEREDIVPNYVGTTLIERLRGIYLNSIRVHDINQPIGQGFHLLKVGKREPFLIKCD